MNEAQELRSRVLREGIDPAELDDILKRLRQLDDERIYKDASELQRLQSFVAEGLKRFEYALRRQTESKDKEVVLSAADEVPDLARLAERQVADPGRAVEGWVRQFTGRTRPTLGLLQAMTEAIHRGFSYIQREAEGTQAPAETLARGSGTCRDFALLMMEAARSLGLAARFVTGYLYDSGTTMTGGGQGCSTLTT